MKKTKKRVLGLLSLVLVAIVTVFAALLPSPGTSAATNSVTDTIVVRVVGDVPRVEITGLESGADITKPDVSFTFDYENVEYVNVYLYYTDDQGITHQYTIVDSFFADYEPGTYQPPITLDLLAEDYGYGYYVVEVEGIGYNGVIDTDLIDFTFYPVTGEIDESEDDGLTYLDLNYDTSNEEIDTIKINIYDENGNLVSEISPITVEAPGERVELPFSENNLPTGNYRIEITAYNDAGELLYGKPYTLYYYYEAIPVPDTGALFENLNISKTDYLITGLLIFLSAAGLGIVFVAKNKNSKARLGRKRR